MILGIVYSFLNRLFYVSVVTILFIIEEISWGIIGNFFKVTRLVNGRVEILVMFD